MTTRTNRIEEIFADARDLQADALEMLALGKVRNAAEKAWGATKRASDALVLARTGEEPERTPETGAGLRLLASLDETVREARLLRRYYSRQGSLHGECFYNGLCDPLEDTERRIRPSGEAISVESQGSASTFSGTLQEPEITSSSDSIAVEGAGVTFGDPLQEP